MKKKTTNKQLAKALYEAVKDAKAGDLKKILAGFVVILAREHKLKKIGYILEEYIKYAKAREGIQTIEITTARELDKKIIERIRKAFGDNTEATVNVDESLLGGVMVRTEDKILDASLKMRLTRLKNLMV